MTRIHTNRGPASPKVVPTRDNAQTPLDETFDALAKRLLEEWHVPGMSVAVIDGDQTFAKACPLSLSLKFISLTGAGLWLRTHPERTSHARNTLLRSQHNKVIHVSSYITAHRRRCTSAFHVK